MVLTENSLLINSSSTEASNLSIHFWFSYVLKIQKINKLNTAHDLIALRGIQNGYFSEKLNLNLINYIS